MDTERRQMSDEDIRGLAREAIRTSKTPREAAKKLGVSREATLGLAAGAPVRPATFALIRERLTNALETSNPAALAG